MSDPRRFALLLAALALAPALAAAQAAEERCYGVALAGADDGIGDGDAPGASQVDYQGNAWSWTAADACTTLPLPPQADGTPRRGAYLPLERDLP